MPIIEENNTYEKIITDSDGNVTNTHKEEEHSSTTFKVDEEPDYIKIYTKMWFEFRQFPKKYRELFLQLAIRMSYCHSDNLSDSQLVYVMGKTKKAIMEACGWTTESPINNGLRSLCDCGAIKRIDRDTYQINPEFAGKGAWRYSEKAKRGGVKDLVATFHFGEDGSMNMDTDITFTEPDNDDEDE